MQHRLHWCEGSWWPKEKRWSELLKDNRDFHDALNELGLAHAYEEFPGEHNWDYWDLHIGEALKFHAQL